MLEIVQALENLLNAHKIAFRPIVTLIHDLGKAFVKVLLEITGMLPTLIQLYICSSSLVNYARAGSTPMDFYFSEHEHEHEHEYEYEYKNKHEHEHLKNYKKTWSTPWDLIDALVLL
jgi:ABC-type nickel/cobalt efflux system permease component RcnA